MHDDEAPAACLEERGEEALILLVVHQGVGALFAAQYVAPHFVRAVRGIEGLIDTANRYSRCYLGFPLVWLGNTHTFIQSVVSRMGIQKKRTIF